MVSFRAARPGRPEAEGLGLEVTEQQVGEVDFHEATFAGQEAHLPAA